MVWFKVDDGFYSSRKVLSIPRPQRLAAVGLWTLAGNWSGRELTDGIVPAYVLTELGSTPRLRRALVEARLWLDRGSAGIEVANWAEYQPTRADVEGERAKAAERQQKWRDKRRADTRDNTVSNAVTNTVSNGGSNSAPTRPDPTRIEGSKDPSSSEIADATVRPDVERLLGILETAIVANGSKKPSRSKRSRDAIRLLLDRDGKTVDQVERAIRFSQDDEFWRGVILSAANLRENYDKLRLAAARSTTRAGTAAIAPVDDVRDGFLFVGGVPAISGPPRADGVKYMTADERRAWLEARDAKSRERFAEVRGA